MLCFVDEAAHQSYSYENLFDIISHQQVLSRYVYTRDVFDVVVSVVAAIVYGKKIVLVDGDFSDIELQQLNIDKEKLSEKYEITEQKRIIDNKQFVDIVSNNLDKVTIGIFTSGTTGRPKCFEHSLRSLLRNIKVDEKHKSDIWGFAYNVTHFAGLQVLLQAVMNYNPMINLFGRNMVQADDLMVKYRCNCISATPTFYKNSLLTIGVANLDVKHVTFGGEKFSDSLLDKVRAKFPKANVRNVYASTEVGSLLSGNSESFIIPQNLKNLIKFSDDGHLLLHKSLVLHKKISEEWYDTGDLVLANGDGTFKILSRDSDFINVGGYKVNPYEVEAVIQEIDEVMDVRVYGRDNSVMGKILVADIVTAEQGKIELKKKIFKILRDELQEYKVPRIVKFVDKIESSRTGKKVH